MADFLAYGEGTIPAGIRSRFVDNSNGLSMHILEAGYDEPGRPLVMLLHGFPELAYSWRKVMLPLAAQGYHVVAPDQRGYGRTTGWNAEYDADLAPFGPLNLVRDIVGLVAALGYVEVRALIGHDYGSPVTAWCSLVRPDIFRSCVLMSAPFGGPPALPMPGQQSSGRGADVHDAMAALDRPRKHYQWYYATRPANDDMMNCPEGVHDFLRAYYHHKSADWTDNKPYPLKGWTAEELAKLPTYYVMDLAETMPETVAHEMPRAAEIAACQWLPDEDLAVYSGEYGRISFKGGLQFYRVMTGGTFLAEMQLFSGRTIDVPSMFIAGTSDWGTYQKPGDFERMQGTSCTNMIACDLIDGAGHWVQQEQHEKVSELLIDFISEAKAKAA